MSMAARPSPDAAGQGAGEDGRPYERHRDQNERIEEPCGSELEEGNGLVVAEEDQTCGILDERSYGHRRRAEDDRRDELRQHVAPAGDGFGENQDLGALPILGIDRASRHQEDGDDADLTEILRPLAEGIAPCGIGDQG